MSCNLGKTGTRFAVNSQMFVILFWFLVDISSSRQEQKMRRTRGTRFSKVFIRVLTSQINFVPALCGPSNMNMFTIFIRNSSLVDNHSTKYISVTLIWMIKAMFTLYRIGFCSVSKVAPAQCQQELMFCCGAEIVPKRSQCEQKPYPLCNLQRSFLI